jgi:hypothetical protein
VDGNEEQRTQTRNGVSAACTPTPAPARSTTPATPVRPR